MRCFPRYIRCLFHYIRCLFHYIGCSLRYIRCFFHYTRCWFYYIRCFLHYIRFKLCLVLTSLYSVLSSLYSVLSSIWSPPVFFQGGQYKIWTADYGLRTTDWVLNCPCGILKRRTKLCVTFSCKVSISGNTRRCNTAENFHNHKVISPWDQVIFARETEGII